MGLLRRPREPDPAAVAIALFFFINGMVFGSWLPRIPDVKAGLGLGPAALGAALLAVPVSALGAMLLSGWLVDRHGGARTTLAAMLALCATVPLPTLAGSWLVLALALVLVGAAMGAFDCAMNVEAAAIEKRNGRAIMSTCHGVFSLGAMAGAGSGGLIAAAGLAPPPHLATVALAMAALGLWLKRFLPHVPSAAADRAPLLALPSRALAGLGLIAFCVLFGEGVMADWTAVYLRESLGAGAAMAGLGFAAFAAAMALGRLTGDRLAAWLGPLALVRGGALVAAIGMTVGLVAGQPWAALGGFALVGLGFAGVIPIVFRAAAVKAGRPPSHSLAAVALTGYLGFLAGPPVVGLIAELASLERALGIVAVLALAIALLAAWAGVPVRLTLPTSPGLDEPSATADEAGRGGLSGHPLP